MNSNKIRCIIISTCFILVAFLEKSQGMQIENYEKKSTTFEKFVENLFDSEIEILKQNYDALQLFDNSLKNNFIKSCIFIEKKLKELGDKNLGIVFAENHNSVSSTCLQILILKYLKSVGVNNHLIECTHNGYEKVVNMGDDDDPIYLFRNRVQEAKGLGMNVIPVDTVEEQLMPKGMDQAIDLIFNEKRENGFKNKIMDLNDHFIFSTGLYHTSFLYNDIDFRDKYEIILLYSPFLYSDSPQFVIEEEYSNYAKNRIKKHYDLEKIILSNENKDILHIPLPINDGIGFETMLALHENGFLTKSEVEDWFRRNPKDDQ